MKIYGFVDSYIIRKLSNMMNPKRISTISGQILEHAQAVYFNDLEFDT